MWLIRLAWKNMWRNRNRTFIAMASIFFAVLLSVVTRSLQKGVFDNLVKNVVSFYSGYLQIHRNGYWDERILDNTFRESGELEKKVRSVPHIADLTPRLESFALVSSADLTKGCMVVGISPSREDAITHLADKVFEGRYLSEGDAGLLVGKGLVERLHAHVGDTIVLLGQGYHGATAVGKYPIQGLLKFGSPELNDQALFLTLREAQNLYSADSMLTSYVLALDDPVELHKASASLKAAVDSTLEVMTWEEMMPVIEQGMKTDQGSLYIILAILYVLVSLGILSTVLMMMVERKYEMGMLIAIGMKRAKLIQLVMVESVVTVLTGCALGLVASFPVVYWLYTHPIRLSGEMGEMYEQYGFEPVFPATLDPTIFLNQGLIVLIVGLLLSLYPVVRIVRLDPVLAMRK